VKLDIIIAGYDPVALDTAICRIIDFNPDDVYYIKKLQEKGFGSAEFEILGEPIENIKRMFKKPKSHPVSVPLPKFLAKYVGNVIFRSSIKFDRNKCQLCGTCWKNCPVQAITPPEKRRKSIDIPKWDKNKCITCYCCAELCPYEAVDFKINILKNILTSYLSIIGIGGIGMLIILIFLIFIAIY
ncbi:MAG: 4Fe-4S binding protein, partial [Promethearchaeota archaeon]